MAAAARRVVVDVRMLGDGGIGTYLNEVVPRVIGLRPNWHFTLLGDPDALTAASWMQRDAGRTNIAIVQATSRIYTIAEQLELLWRSPRDADLFWAPHYNVPLLANIPLVVTIHDVCHLALPEATGSWPRRMYAKHVYGVIRRRARGLLFDSEFSRAEMARLVGESDAPAAVAPLAADAWFDLQRNGRGDRPMRDPYLLYVGNAKRHKNIPALLEAFRRVADRVPHRLVLLGRHTGLRADPAIADALRLVDAGRVVVTGEVSHDVLRTYMAHADVFVTASRYEGFGLPALEAMAAGCPCVVSRAGSLPEVCGDAARYCDPDDPGSIAEAMLDVATDQALRERLIVRGRSRATQFSWERCAAITVDLLERALG